MTDVVIPSPGESISEVTLGQWQRQDGDWVEKDDLLCEIESDKATLELLAPDAGVFKSGVAGGSEQKVGAVVASIDTKAAKPAAVPVGAGSSGVASSAVATKGASSAPAGAVEAPPSGGASSGERKVTPVARKLAADRGVDLARVEGTGPSGRVMREDVERKLVAAPAPATAAGAADGARSGASSAAAAGKSGAGAVPDPKPAPAPGTRGVRRERIPKIRQRIAERLVEAKLRAAMLTTFNECDMTEVMRLRNEHKEAFEKRHGVSLGFMGFFIRAAVSALQKYPKVNCYMLEEEFQFHDYCDVAVAVGTDRGLVVPVIRNAEALSFAGIERTIRELAVRARDGKLTVDEMTGGTFTVSNGGIYGNLMSTPILNTPQTGILGMHAIKRRAVEDPANPGQVAIRPMMYLAMSYDHRVIDGAEAVGFLIHIKECIEKPERLLLGL